jgi:hypothetical protein
MAIIDNLADEIFQVLKGFGKILSLFDDKGKRVFEPSQARRMFAQPDKMMISIDDEGDNSEVKLLLSQSVNIKSIKRFLDTLRQLCTRFNVLFNVRKYGRELAPKDFAYQSFGKVTALAAESVKEDMAGQVKTRVITSSEYGARVYRNPNYSYILKLLKNRPIAEMFGLVHNDDLYVWMKSEASHKEMASDLQLKDTIPVTFSIQHGNIDMHCSPQFKEIVDSKEAIKRMKIGYTPESIFEAMYGSSKISYQKFGNAKLMIRHSARINEGIRGARSRHINTLFVETNLGERFLFPVIHLSGARAWAQHINNGGKPFDDISQHIIEMAHESKKLANINKYIRSNQQALSEEALNLRTRVRERIVEIRKELGKFSRERGYKKATENVDFSYNIINENQDAINEEYKRLGILLGIQEGHDLADALMPVALLTKGENIMNKPLRHTFHRVVTLENTNDLVETLINEYGYQEGTHWAKHKNGIGFILPEAYDDAKVYLDIQNSDYKVVEAPEMPEAPKTDKVLAYAEKWVEKQGGLDKRGWGDIRDMSGIVRDPESGAAGPLWGPSEKADMSNKANELAQGLRDFNRKTSC